MTEYENDLMVDQVNEDNNPRNEIDREELLKRGKRILNTDTTDVQYLKLKDIFTVTSECAFKMPECDGGWYWEREIDSFESYTPREFGIFLDRYWD